MVTNKVRPATASHICAIPRENLNAPHTNLYCVVAITYTPITYV